jgi:hypothetical protein
VSATIDAVAYTLACYAQVCDLVSLPFSTAHAAQLTAVYNKLPSKPYLAGSSNTDGDIQLDEATGTPADSAGTGTLLSRLTSGRAGNLDNLDATVSSRSSHSAADVWAVATRTLTAATNITTDIASAVWAHATAVAFIAANAAIKVVTDKLATMLQASGLNWQFTTDAVENAPAGGGGGGGQAGSGSIAYTETINRPDTTTPLGGAEVWVSTDEDGENVVAGTLTTDDFGQVTFMLDAGTYYFWVDHPGYNFDNPTEVEVEA